MSAWEVTTAHIDTLINAAMDRRRESHMCRLSWYHNGQRRQIDETNASDVGAMLVRMNYASVDYLYRKDGAEGSPDGYPEPYRFSGSRGHLIAVYSPVVILKAIHCFEYQSCEHPTWEGSEAQAYCQALRMQVIEWLPGYQAAPWGLTDVMQAVELSGV
jgi:hypothetical protein